MRTGARILANGTILPPPGSFVSILPIPRDNPRREKIVRQSSQTTPPPRFAK